jgi:hypothetical protein
MRGNRTGRPLAIEARRAAGGYLAVSAGASTAILALAVLHLAQARPYRFRAVAALTLLFGVSYTAVAYCQGTLLRNEIEAREAGKLEAATDHAASAIANRHGSGEIAAKIQAHVIVAVA